MQLISCYAYTNHRTLDENSILSSQVFCYHIFNTQVFSSWFSLFSLKKHRWKRQQTRTPPLQSFISGECTFPNPTLILSPPYFLTTLLRPTWASANESYVAHFDSHFRCVWLCASECCAGWSSGSVGVKRGVTGGPQRFRDVDIVLCDKGWYFESDYYFVRGGNPPPAVISEWIFKS